MRLTVNLDSDTNEKLTELAEGEGASKSQLVRDAINHYHRLHHEWPHITKDQLIWYVRLLGGTEHRILDVEHVDSLFDRIDSIEELESEWYKIGQKHGIEWARQFSTLRKHGIEWARQFSTLREKLRVLEYCNWYSVTSVDENQYALTFSNEREANLISAFLRGECEELGFDIEIKQIDRKLIVTKQSSV